MQRTGLEGIHLGLWQMPCRVVMCWLIMSISVADCITWFYNSAFKTFLTAFFASYPSSICTPSKCPSHPHLPFILLARQVVSSTLLLSTRSLLSSHSLLTPPRSPITCAPVLTSVPSQSTRNA